MHKWPLQLRLLQKPRFIPIRYRVIFANACMLIIVLGVLIITLGWFQNRTIRHQLEQRGKAIAQSLVATSTKALLNYDYVTLEQFANRASQDPGIFYVIVHDKERRIAGFSGRPDLQGKTLTDPVTLAAVAHTGPLVQNIDLVKNGHPGLEVALPVVLPDSLSRWGTIRVGLSLATMYQQRQQTIWIVIGVGIVALSVGTIMSILGAHQVTRPIGELALATMNVAKGNFRNTIGVRTGDEVGVLAANFSEMTREVLAHQKRQEEQLKEIQRLQDYAEKLMTTMADGLLTVNMAGELVTINPAAKVLLGIHHIDTSRGGENIGAILGESCRLVALINKIIHRPVGIANQEIEIRQDSDVQTILVGSSILHDVKGQPIEIILNLHDISNLKKLEARIRQSERLAALGTLAAGMAHEIRNPLSAIKTFVQLLPRKVDKPGFLEKFNRTVPRETERINLLVEELLELSRVPKYEFVATDINRVLQQTIEAIGEELLQRNIECEVELQNDLPDVQADSNQLTKAFHNLARNGIQAMPTGGRLIIKTVYEDSKDSEKQIDNQLGSQLQIIFQDTGKGIEAAVLQQIFNPFFTTKDRGTGLGLPITHKVITEHGGQIDAESQLEQGTKFTIHLPVLEKGAALKTSDLELV